MLDTFKAQLKAKAKALGVNLSQKRIDAFADRLHKKNPDITEVSDHDAKIDELHELQPLDEVAKADDKARSLEAKLTGKANPNQDKKDDDDKKDTDDPEPPKWAQKLINEIDSLKKGQSATTIKEKLSLKLKGEDGKDIVPAAFLKGRALPEKEEDLDSFIEEAKNDWTAFRQEQINAGLMNESTPKSASTTDVAATKVDADIKAWAEKGKTAQPTK